MAALSDRTNRPAPSLHPVKSSPPSAFCEKPITESPALNPDHVRFGQLETLQALLDEACSALRQERVETARLRTLLQEEQARAAAREQAIGHERIGSSWPELAYTELAAASSPCQQAHLTSSDDVRDPATPIWLREAATVLDTFSENEVGLSQEILLDISLTPCSSGGRRATPRDGVPMDYLKVWLVQYLTQVYGGAPREKHAELARVLVSMLELPKNETTRLEALFSSTSTQTVPSMPSLRAEQSPVWRGILACSGAAVLVSNDRRGGHTDEEAQLVADNSWGW